METQIYNQKGKTTGKIELPEAVFGVPWNADLVHQVVMSMLSNKRAGTANTKGSGDVRGGGKKPWKQKGTGRARHSSIRSPIWKGGGVTHGPLAEKNYDKKINKKMRAKALYTVLSQKLRDGQILFVDSLTIAKAKTKDAKAVLESLATISGFEKLKTAKKPIALLAMATKSESTNKSYRNLPQCTFELVGNINPAVLLSHKYVIIEEPAKSVEIIGSRLAKAE